MIRTRAPKGVDLVPHKAKKRPVRAVLNNSFGFGGTNASLDHEGRVRKLIAAAAALAHRGAGCHLSAVVGRAERQSRHTIMVRGRRDPRPAVARGLETQASDPGNCTTYCGDGAAVRLARPDPGRRVRGPGRDRRRRAARPAAARQAGAAADHGDRRHAGDHRRREARGEPVSDRRGCRRSRKARCFPTATASSAAKRGRRSSSGCRRR